MISGAYIVWYGYVTPSRPLPSLSPNESKPVKLVLNNSKINGQPGENLYNIFNLVLKILAVLAVIAAVSAQSHYGHQEHHQPQHYHHEEEHHGPVHYEYHYDVHDDHTGDVHGQREARKDESTQGEYYLIDADGHKRTVKYHVEGKSGFIAEVHREPIKGYQAPQPQHHYQPQHHHEAPAHHNYHH
ncbi:histidine-rich glycoprotein-like [Anopheles ziemanni]|uniref:histidine-rich glycoprotein-like n=1 Tax=Anopheles coustani TaxID=139045 RepID=UPI00265A286B|nr:histidine-rich glycoprotein-like [Anopheles coustani]XP_058177621.1 histidine-rich glycoprotein-like [Anopheles ziemanni]